MRKSEMKTISHWFRETLYWTDYYFITGQKKINWPYIFPLEAANCVAAHLAGPNNKGWFGLRTYQQEKHSCYSANSVQERKVFTSRGERVSPWLCECVWVVRRPDEALVLQAFGNLWGGDELTTVIVVLLLAQRFSIRGGGWLIVRHRWQLGVLVQRRIGCSVCQGLKGAAEAWHVGMISGADLAALEQSKSTATTKLIQQTLSENNDNGHFFLSLLTLLAQTFF